MAFLIIILGLLLGGGGAFFVLLGFDIVMTERGAAMTIGGTVALSGGIVTLAVGCALVRLTQILRVLKAPAPSAGTPLSAPETASAAQPSGTMAAGAAAAALATGAAVATASSAAQATEKLTPASEDAEAAGPLPDAPSAASDESDHPMTAPQPRPADDTYRTDHFFAELDDVLAPLPGKSLVNEGSQFIDREAPERPAIDPMPPTRGLPAPPNFEELLGRALEREPDASPDALADADLPLAGNSSPVATPSAVGDDLDSNSMAAPAEPVVLGSYKAGGRSYTMYSDGSVEAVTEVGVERFASLESLRAHLARP